MVLGSLGVIVGCEAEALPAQSNFHFFPLCVQVVCEICSFAVTVSYQFSAAPRDTAEIAITFLTRLRYR
jgi:hypothetical protein